jgi:hypothetical protein
VRAWLTAVAVVMVFAFFSEGLMRDFWPEAALQALFLGPLLGTVWWLAASDDPPPVAHLWRRVRARWGRRR